MARTIGQLTALKVDKAKEPGMYGDGGGLYLRVTPDRAKNWVFRFMLNGRARWMGMGPLHTVSLLEARKRASEHRLQRHDGIDPIEARRAERRQAQLDAAKAITFKECAESYIKAHRAGWRNGKHASQWEATGKVISITCCRHAARCGRSSTTLHCPTVSCRASW